MFGFELPGLRTHPQFFQRRNGSVLGIHLWWISKNYEHFEEWISKDEPRITKKSAFTGMENLAAFAKCIIFVCYAHSTRIVAIILQFVTFCHGFVIGAGIVWMCEVAFFLWFSRLTTCLLTLPWERTPLVLSYSLPLRRENDMLVEHIWCAWFINFQAFISSGLPVNLENAATFIMTSIAIGICWK